MEASQIKRLTVAAGLFSALVGLGNASDSLGLILWNSLGSDEEITHSQVGPNGYYKMPNGNTRISSFVGGKIGGGIHFPAEIEVLAWANPRQGLVFELEPNSLSTAKGRVEMWLRPDRSSSDIPGYDESSGLFSLRGWNKRRGITFGLFSPVLQFGIAGWDEFEEISIPHLTWIAGELFHFALSWDHQAGEVRVYKNDQLVETVHPTPALWGPDHDIGFIVLGNNSNENIDLIWVPADSMIDEFKVWDNPEGVSPVPLNNSIQSLPSVFNPDRGESVYIHWIPDRSGICSVKIYDMRGKKVAVVSERIEVVAPIAASVMWDGKDSDHQTVGSGIYVAVVESAGKAKKTKIAVVR